MRSVDTLRAELLESRRKVALADHGISKLDEDRRVRTAELVDLNARLRDSEAEVRPIFLAFFIIPCFLYVLLLRCNASVELVIGCTSPRSAPKV